MFTHYFTSVCKHSFQMYMKYLKKGGCWVRIAFVFLFQMQDGILQSTIKVSSQN